MKSIGIVIFTALLSAVFSSNVYADEDVISLGMSLSISGENNRESIMQLRGYRLWESEINEKGGLLGKKVRLVIQDDRGSSQDAVRIYRSFIEGRQVDFVLGPYSSRLTLAVAPIAEKHHYPLLVAGAAADNIWQQGYRFIFGMWTPASQYVLGFLEMLSVYNMQTLAILSADDSFSLSIARGTRDWAIRLGLSVESFQQFPSGEKNLLPFIEEARKSAVDAVITTGHFIESYNVRLALKTLGWKPKLFLATVGPNFQEYYTELKDDAEGVFTVSIWEPHPLLNFPGAQDFSQKFEAKFGASPTYHAATAYAAGEILAKAVEKAGSIDREKVRSQLSAMSTYSIIGRYGVDRTGLQVKRFPLCIQWQHGRKEIVWPRELSTAVPIIE